MPHSFTFNLDPLLRRRRLEERDRQLEVARIERQRMTMEADLRRQQEQMLAAREVLRSSLAGTLDAQNLRMYANAALQQLGRAQRLVPELATVHRGLAAARAELEKAVRQRRALELLRERRRAAWQQRVDRAEIADHDDLINAKRAAR